MKKGFATLLTVMIASIVAVFVLITWQSRLLLAIYRHRSLSDVVLAGYNAESSAFDLVTRFLNYDAFDPGDGSEYNKTFGPGEKVSVTVAGTIDNQEILIDALWPYASTKLALTRQHEAPNTEILFALDCTGSMGEKACPTCTKTRMEEQIVAVRNFLQKLKSEDPTHGVSVGISVFAERAQWLKDASGMDISPNTKTPIDDIDTALASQFDRGGSVSEGGFIASPACRNVGNYTNLGKGLTFVHDYFVSGLSSPGAKKIEILVTDGEPTATSPNSVCRQALTCTTGSMDPETCKKYSRDFLKCGLAKNTVKWNSEIVLNTDKKESILADSRVLGLLAFGEPTATPIQVPTNTPRPTSTPGPLSTPKPTNTPGPSSTPKLTATPVPAYCNLSIQPTSGNWNFTPSFTVTNYQSSSVAVDWSTNCFTCGLTPNSGTQLLAPNQSFQQGMGAICDKWSFDAHVRNCPQNGFTVEKQNCPITPTPTNKPAPTATTAPSSGRDYYGVRDPVVDLYTVTVLDPQNAQIEQIFSSLSTGYYPASNATELQNILSKILGSILNKLQIKRVLPS